MSFDFNITPPVKPAVEREIFVINVNVTNGLASFFKQDHRDCDSGWANLEELLDKADMEKVRPAWEKYDKNMRRHLAMEEEILFPAFDVKSGMGGRGPTAMMKMEHQQMRGLLDQIGDAIAAGDTQEAMDVGDTLLMLVQQHNVKEEGMLYPMAESILVSEWARMAEMLEEY